jgi:hypothetical protein
MFDCANQSIIYTNKKQIMNNNKLYKSIIAALALASYAFGSVSLNVGYENEYVFRGNKLNDEIGYVEASVSSDNLTFTVTGIWGLDVSSTSAKLDELDLTVEALLPVQSAQISVGATSYIYPSASKKLLETRYSFEGFVAISYDAFLSPTVGAYYDFALETITFELSLSQDLLVPGFDRLYVVPGVNVGWVNAKNAEQYSPLRIKNEYRYVDGQLDLAYVAGPLRVAGGVRHNILYDGGETKQTWYGMSVGLNF